MQGITIINANSSNGCLYVEFERQDVGGGFTAFRVQLSGTNSFIECDGIKIKDTERTVMAFLSSQLFELTKIYPNRIDANAFCYYATGFAEGYRLAEARQQAL